MVVRHSRRIVEQKILDKEIYRKKKEFGRNKSMGPSANALQDYMHGVKSTASDRLELRLERCT